MRVLTIVLDATDTPKSIATLANLAGNIEGFADPDARGARAHNILWFRIYPEGGNDASAPNGPARVSFEQTRTQGSFKVSRVVATQHGIPLLPGIATDFPSGGGRSAGLYDFSITSISGQIGDQFQIVYGPA